MKRLTFIFMLIVGASIWSYFLLWLAAHAIG